MIGFGGNREKLTFIAVIAVIILLVGGAFAVNALRDETPGNTSSEAGFLRDMQTHHSQAVVMSMIVRDRTGDDQIQAMTTDIAFSQTSQIGTMMGFLNIWDLNPTGNQQPMEWMGHAMPGLMPGMATSEEVEALRTLAVTEAETLFLQLMTRHHIAGVEMAQAVIDRSDQDDIVELAESMIRVQGAEIEVMNQFLADRGVDPVTTSDAEVQVPDSASPAATQYSGIPRPVVPGWFRPWVVSAAVGQSPRPHTGRGYRVG